MELSNIKPDFNGLLAQLTADLQTRKSFRDILTSSTGETLLEYIAAIGTMLLYSVERSIEELNITTAKNRSSIYSIANLLGVNSRRAVGAEVTVTLTLPSPIPSVISLKKYDQFTINGISFFLTQDTNLSANQTSFPNIVLRQGSVTERVFVSTGEVFQQYTIGSNYLVDNEYIDVTVGTDPAYWTRITTALWLYSGAQKVYHDMNMPDGTVKILFGNNTNGMVPSNGSEIKIKEVISAGVGGNISSSGHTVTPVVQPLYGGNPVGLTGVTTSNSANGDDPESLDVLRFTTPRFFASGQRAVTRSDWKAIGMKFAGVKDINVWGEYEEGAQLNMMNTVKVTLLMANGAATSVEKNNFDTYMLDYKVMNTRILHQDASPVLLSINVDIYIRLGFNQEQVKASIQAIINDYFSFKQGLLGRSVYVSDIVEKILSVPGVDYLSLNSPLKPTGVSGVTNVDTPTTTPTTSGGSMSDGTYYYVVTALIGTQETGRSVEQSAVISGGGGNGKVTVDWTAVTGATSYRVYRGTTSGTYTVYYTATTNGFTDTGAAGASGSPSVINQAPVALSRHQYVKLQPTPYYNMLVSSR